MRRTLEYLNWKATWWEERGKLKTQVDKTLTVMTSKTLTAATKPVYSVDRFQWSTAQARQLTSLMHQVCGLLGYLT